jgi:hypothetical protein
MGSLFFIDYFISFIVLIAVHAPWWSWLIYVVSALFWLGIGPLGNDEVKGKTTDTSKQEQP